MSEVERGEERADDAAEMRAKEEGRREFGVCWCGHLRMAHPTPHLCEACGCGEYREVARI